MLKLFKGANVFLNGKFVIRDFYIDDSKKFNLYNNQEINFDEVIDCSCLYAFPGFIDTHVHLREPGFEYKETIKTATLSAAKGGYTTVFAMPNLNPVPDNIKNLEVEKKLIKDNALINVIPVCSITKGQKGTGTLSDIDNLAIENKLFSDDGKGIQSSDLMKLAMEKVSSYDGYILAHCEDESELCGGSLNKGTANKKFNDPGINNASEYNQVIRDIKLAKETKCKYHICHISTKESVVALKNNKDNNISGEVTAHHLFLNENDIVDNNGKWKMNPPLRSVDDQTCLNEAVIDGTIEMLCTDNAPHSIPEKNCKINEALMGVVTIEAAYALLYTNMVKTGKISLEKSLELVSSNAAKRFKIPGGNITDGQTANICIWDLNERWNINSSNFASIGKSCPFDGKEVFGKCKMTICNGKIVFRENL